MAINQKAGVRLIHAALDESPLRGGTIILRGVLDQKTLSNLRLDDYQREAAPLSSLSSIWKAIKAGDPLPDIELGMRGKRVTGAKDEYILQDPVYIIDGQQRVGCALYHLTQFPDAIVNLGATVHFDTTRIWEKDRFRVLNSSRMKVAPSVLLRNEREQVPALGSLYGLSTNDKHFVLYNKVCWKQRKARTDLITGLMLVRTALTLHAHKASYGGTNLIELVNGVTKCSHEVGAGNLRENLKEFFRLIDDCWGVSNVSYTTGAPHLKLNFLLVLAKLISDHYAFWRQPDEKTLSIPLDLKRKLKLLNVHDPAVVNLSGGSGKAKYMLYLLIRDHINSGKRTRHIRSRLPSNAVQMDAEDEQEEAA